VPNAYRDDIGMKAHGTPKNCWPGRSPEWLKKGKDHLKIKITNGQKGADLAMLEHRFMVAIMIKI